MKYFGIFCTISLLVCLVVSDPITWGNVADNDRLLGRDVVSKKSNMFGIHKVIVSYPPEDQQSYETLTGIRLWDYGGRSNFGYALQIGGGVGYINSTIELTSQRGKPLYYTIEYYGH